LKNRIKNIEGQSKSSKEATENFSAKGTFFNENIMIDTAFFRIKTTGILPEQPQWVWPYLKILK
jgi:hypothetical protein